MTPSFDLFDFGANRRAYLSTSDLERACYLSAMTGVPVETFTDSADMNHALDVDSNQFLLAQIGSR